MRHTPRAAFPLLSATPVLRPAFWHGQPLQRVAVADAAALARLSTAPGGLRPIALPADAAERAGFLKRWVARTVAGLAGAVLVLPLAALAQGTEFVAATEIAGVEAVTLQADGSARIDLANGRAVTVPAAEVQVTAAGEIMVAAQVAEAVAAAAQAVAMAGAGAAALGGLAALGAAGGGGSDGPATETPVEPPVEPPPPELLSGTLVDGYIAGATVFEDVNRNGTFDESFEPSTTTNETGGFSFTVPVGDGPLVAFGGIDIATGADFTGTLTAPAGSTVITPLTTLVQSLVEASGGATDAATAAGQIRTALGLGADVDLTKLDPVAEAARDGGSAEALAAAAQVANVLIVAKAAGATEADVARQLAQSLAGAAEGAGKAALADGTVIAQAVQAGLQPGSTADAAAIGTLLAQANATVQDAVAEDGAGVHGIETVQSVVADRLSKDVAGNTLPESYEVIKDTAVPLMPVVTSYGAAADGTVNAAESGEVVIAGTGRVGTTVHVDFGGIVKTAGIVAGEGSDAASGAWSVTYDADVIPDFPADGAAVPIRVWAVQPAEGEGGVAVASLAVTRTVILDTEAPDAPVLDPVAGDNILNIVEHAAAGTGGITVTGRAEPGAGVVVRLGTQEEAVTADASGVFTAPLDRPENGDNLTARAIDAAGNQSAASPAVPITFDLVAPEVLTADLVADSGSDATDRLTNNPALQLTHGAVEDGATIQYQVAVDGGAPGDWLPTGDYVPPDGVLSVWVRQVDTAGNPSDPSQPVVFTLDTQAPDAPAIGVTATDGVINAAEAQSLGFAGNAEAGASVTVSFAGGVRTVTAETGGTWLADFGSVDLSGYQGLQTVTATARDAAGNTTEAAGSAQVTVDTLPPEAPVIVAAGDDGIVNGAATAVVVTGTAAEGDVVAVTLGDVTVPATRDGVNWTASFDVPPVDGPYTVTATARDAAGNTTEAAAGAPVTVDTAAGSVTATLAGDNLVTLAEVAGGTALASGTAESGSAISVTLGAGAAVAATADADGNWSVAVPLPATGTAHGFAVTATDLAGNVATTAVNVTIQRLATATVNGLAFIDDLAEWTFFRDGDVVADADGLTITTTGTELDAFDSVVLRLTIADFAHDADADGPTPTAGRVTGARFTVDGQEVLNLTGLDIDAVALNDAIEDDAENEPYDRPTYYDLLAATVLQVTGGTGDDEFGPGTRNADVIDLGAGDDYVLASRGDDTIDGGDGFDQVAYHVLDLPGGITAELGNGNEPGSATANEGSENPFSHTLISVEALRGSQGADRLTGNSGDNMFRGLAGDDTIDGGDGWDEVRYDRDARYGGTAAVGVDLAAGTGLDGFGDTDTLISIEDVTGSAGNDTIRGNDTGNSLDGGAGDDRLYGGDGNDTLRGGDGERDRLYGGAGDDLIDGGAGTRDRAYFSDATAPVFASLAEGLATGQGDDTLDGIERLSGSAYDDTLVGTDQNNGFQGGAGDDSIVGGGGWDFASYNDATAAVQINLASGAVTGGAGDDMLSGIEEIEGSNFGDSITGDGNDNWFVLDTHYDGDPNAGVGGADTVDGGGGWDGVDYGDEGETATQGVVADLQAGTVIDTRGNIDRLSGIEELRGTRHADVMTAADSGSRLRGEGGDDSLTGGAGDDTLTGGAGADRFDISGGGQDVITDFSFTDGDQIETGLDPEAERSAVQAATGDTDATVNLWGGNSVTLAGWSPQALWQAYQQANSPDDPPVDPVDRVVASFTGTVLLESWLPAMVGVTPQIVSGGVSFATGPDGVTVILSGTDLAVTDGNLTSGLITGASFSVGSDVSTLSNLAIDAAAVQNALSGDGAGLLALFTSRPFDATGSTGDDDFPGTDGHDLLRGGEGDDRFQGGLGDDTIFGGTEAGDAGLDSVSYLLDGYRIRVDLENGEVDIVAGQTLPQGQGHGDGNVAFEQELIGIEEVIGTAGDDHFIGSAGDDTFTGGAGHDVFVLSGGDDVITDFRFAEDRLDNLSISDALAAIGQAELVTSDHGTGLLLPLGQDRSLTLINYTNTQELTEQFEFWLSDASVPSPQNSLLLGSDVVNFDYLMWRAFEVVPDASRTFEVTDWTDTDSAVPLNMDVSLSPDDQRQLVRVEVEGDADDTLDVGYEAWFLLDGYGQFVAGVKTPIMATQQSPIVRSVEMFTDDAVYVQVVTPTDGPLTGETEVYRLMLNELAESIVTEFDEPATNASLPDLLTEQTPVAAFVPEGGVDAIFVEGGALSGASGISPNLDPVGDPAYLAFILSKLDLAVDDTTGRLQDTILSNHVAYEGTNEFVILDLGGVLAPPPDLNDDDPPLLEAVTELVGASGNIERFSLRFTPNEPGPGPIYSAFDLTNPGLTPYQPEA